MKTEGLTPLEKKVIALEKRLLAREEELRLAKAKATTLFYTIIEICRARPRVNGAWLQHSPTILDLRIADAHDLIERITKGE
jgi:hypothetical protein